MMHSLTLSDVLADHARSRPQVTAVVDGELRLTYPELDGRVMRLASALDGMGVSRGDRVLWLGQNAYAVLELLLACSRLGAIFCPANWRQSRDELRFVLTDLTPAAVFWEHSETVAPLRDDRWIQAGEAYERLLAGAPVREFAPVADTEPTLALYTAAFDGRPSAALLSSAALVAHATSLLVVRQMEPGFTFLNNGPLFHVGTMMFCLATLQIGGTNVFTPAFDPEEVCRLVDAERVTQAFLFGGMIDAVAKANAGGKYDLSSLRFVAHSAEWDDMITVDDSPWCRSGMGGYGQTEVGGMLTFLGLAEGGAGLAGRPSPLAQVRILGPDGVEVPAGETGEICARGKTLFSGYFARPDLNTQKSAYGWHHTGDLGRREPDGTITFIGPKLRMIKSGAENVYPAEVERALKTHPAVADAAVIGVPDPQWHQAVKAVVSLKPSAQATEDELIAHVRGLLASYKKPRHVTFVDTIPKRGFTPDYDALDAAHGGGNYPGS
ncbi:Long-chain-fatty-acid--CoA ligase [[Actinomadura] parvosata subsp. kistnae]|uniref:AMP-dependent synthetase n=1 Tax=[Actinomadura] parvosata subsp. kistnae TaxID=1909395 RepID=A0A1V0A6U3_9ACTN|nr:AMP-binding protein [Nonomuraea sp. ATCC 55076]AQZ65913.1 AMP-dependent synthetase [Nonomuraea sp. ATCC 55076]SPL97364.1 Long-chain-fatty-acid--CoA ligase [Actinomadura parvosata subsp. kistnae]